MNEDIELSLGKKLAFSATALTLFVILLVALGETAVRFMTPKSDPVKLGVQLEHSARLFGLRTDHQSMQTGVMVRTNSLGFREHEYPVERRPGVRRIVVIGDSYTFGTGVEFPEIYAKRLEALLNQSGPPHEVINFGVPGYNTSLELATFREVAAQFRPDLVIVGYVLNDTERYGRGTRDTGAEKPPSLINSTHMALKDVSMLYRFVAPKLGALAGLFNARYAVGGTSQIIRSFHEEAPGWVESRGALLQVAREARALGAPTLVVVFPMMVDAYPLEAAHRTIAQFCSDHGIDVLDLMPVVTQHRVADMIVPLDGHPNGRAHRIFADRIFEHLKPSPIGPLH